MSHIASHYNHNVAITFDNGITISIGFGTSNYCSRKSLETKSLSEDLKVISVESTNAEIAIWDKEEDFEFAGKFVEGWVNPNDIAKWTYACSIANSLSDLQEMFNSLT